MGVTVVEKDMKEINQNFLKLVEACEEFEHSLQNSKVHLKELSINVESLQKKQELGDNSMKSVAERIEELAKHIRDSETTISSKLTTVLKVSEERLKRFEEDIQVKFVSKKDFLLVKDDLIGTLDKLMDATLKKTTKQRENFEEQHRLMIKSMEKLEKSVTHEYQRKIGELKKNKSSYERSDENIKEVSLKIDSMKKTLEVVNTCTMCKQLPFILLVLFSLVLDYHWKLLTLILYVGFWLILCPLLNIAGDLALWGSVSFVMIGSLWFGYHWYFVISFAAIGLTSHILDVGVNWKYRVIPTVNS